MSDHLRFMRRLSYVVMGGAFLFTLGLGAFMYYHPGYRNTEELVRELSGPHSKANDILELMSNYGSVFSFILFLLIFGIIWFRNR